MVYFGIIAIVYRKAQDQFLLNTVIPLSEGTRIEKIYSVFFKQEYPADLILVIVWLTACVGAIYLPLVNETPVRVVLAIPVILFIPGYILIAALFPKEGDIEFMERIVLSVGISIAVVPLIGLGLNFTPWGIRLDPLVISLTVFSLVMILVAHYRRAILPPEKRFRILFSGIAGTFRKEFFPRDSSSVDRLLGAALALALLVAILVAIYVIAVPKEGEKFTEFYILGENGTAADYPHRITTGQNYPMYIGIRNHEYKNTAYTIETWLLRTEFDNVTNTSQVIVMDPNDRLSFTLAHNETMTLHYNLSVKETIYNRLEFLLFKNNVTSPELTGSDRINASYRDVHLRVTIQ